MKPHKLDLVHHSTALCALRNTPLPCQALPCAAETPGKMERGSAAEIPTELGLLPTLSSMGREETPGDPRAPQPLAQQSSTASSGPCGEHGEGSINGWRGQHRHAALGKALWEQGWPWGRAGQHCWACIDGERGKGKLFVQAPARGRLLCGWARPLVLAWGAGLALWGTGTVCWGSARQESRAPAVSWTSISWHHGHLLAACIQQINIYRPPAFSSSRGTGDRIAKPSKTQKL